MHNKINTVPTLENTDRSNTNKLKILKVDLVNIKYKKILIFKKPIQSLTNKCFIQNILVTTTPLFTASSGKPRRANTLTGYVIAFSRVCAVAVFITVRYSPFV